MKSRSGSVFLLATFLTLAVALACSKHYTDVDVLGNSVGENVAYEGTLSMRGSYPRVVVVLETDSSGVIEIDSKTVQEDLKSLQGMRVAVEGEALAPVPESGTPRVDVARYHLLRLPTGEQPLIGTMLVLDGECILATTEGRRFWIRGDLVGILREYEGERVWVVGTKGAAPNAPPNTQPYWVTGYGVLGQPAAGM